MDKVRCQRCGKLVEKKYIFHCPIHGDFHNDGGIEYCCKFRKRCDGLERVCCPECGFMPCLSCHGYGILKDENNKRCNRCQGKGEEPLRLRKMSADDIPAFEKRMLFEAQQFALQARIRYLFITAAPNSEYVNLKDIRHPGYSQSIRLDRERRRKFYGWLCLFSKGKNRRFMDRWEKLVE